MTVTAHLRPVAAEIVAVADEHLRRLELELIPTGYRPLSPYWRPNDDRSLADRIDAEIRRLVR